MDNTAVIDKIRKLLQVDPEKGATQAEAEQALMAAQRLAMRHNIDLASVDATADTSAGEPIINQPWVPTREGGGECAARLPAAHKFITWILRDYFAVRIIECSNWAEYEDKGVKKEGVKKSLSLVGRQSNVQIAIYVYGFLQREFMDLWHAHKKAYGARMADRNGFFLGLYNGLSAKLMAEKGRSELEAQEALATKGQSMELVLVGEKEKIEQQVKAAHPRLRYVNVSAGPVHNPTAYHDGQRKGSEINIVTAIK